MNDASIQVDGWTSDPFENESWRKWMFPYQSGFFPPVPVPTTWSAPFRRQPSAWQLSRRPIVSEKSFGSIFHEAWNISIVEVSNIKGYGGLCPPSVIGIRLLFPTKSRYLLSLWICESAIREYQNVMESPQEFPWIYRQIIVMQKDSKR